jgi:hypothetical protein
MEYSKIVGTNDQTASATCVSPLSPLNPSLEALITSLQAAEVFSEEPLRSLPWLNGHRS